MTTAFSLPRRSKTISFTKFAAASVRPQRAATRSSFQSTLNMLLNSISPSDKALITETDA